MSVAIVTGSCGLVGAEAVRLLASKGFDVIGLDNDMRRTFFGPDASTAWQAKALAAQYRAYTHLPIDIRDGDAINTLFRRYGRAITTVVHCAAQPSHDWAARDPIVDFGINATGTLILLEAVRHQTPDAVVVFASTNKVYGDQPNRLPFTERETRYELAASHPWAAHGIPEQMPVDHCLHSLFGASKLSADILVQEYGRYFGLQTGCFRCGCITGPGHSSDRLHGFLAYLVRCAVTEQPYTVIGYKGKQVRDNIHAADLVAAFWLFIQQPSSGEVFNLGGGHFANFSVIEAIANVETLTGRPLAVTYSDEPRTGDHQWWISDVRKFQSHYPNWKPTFDTASLIADIYDGLVRRHASYTNAQ